MTSILLSQGKAMKKILLNSICALTLTACAANSSNIDTSHLNLVKENHAEINANGNKYIIDSYIIPFQQPYYILIRNDKNTPITSDIAHSIAEQYIKPRGCTTTISRRIDLDKSNNDHTQWIIGIEC